MLRPCLSQLVLIHENTAKGEEIMDNKDCSLRIALPGLKDEAKALIVRDNRLR